MAKINSYPAYLETPYKAYLCGTEGCGKNWQAEQICKDHTRLCVFDPMQNWTQAKTFIAGDLMELSKALKKKQFRIAFRPNIYGLKEQFDIFNKMVFAVGRMMLVEDEINMVTYAHHTPASMLNVTSRSRHRGIYMLAMSQRPAETGKSYISNATEVYAGNLSAATDLKILREKIGVDFVKDLPNLPLRKMKHWKRPQFEG